VSTSVTVNGSTYTAPGPGRDSNYGATATALLVALAANAGRDYSHTIFVQKNGTGGDGLTPAKAETTFTAAMATASALTPAVSKIIAVVCLDGGPYSESFTIPEYVYVIAPACWISGKVTLNQNCGITAHRIINASGTCIQKTAGTGSAFIDVRVLGDGTGSAIVIDASMGTINARVDVLSAVTSYNLGASTVINYLGLTSSGSATVGSGTTANVLLASTGYSGGSSFSTVTINGIQFSANADVGLYQI